MIIAKSDAITYLVLEKSSIKDLMSISSTDSFSEDLSTALLMSPLNRLERLSKTSFAGLPLDLVAVHKSLISFSRRITAWTVKKIQRSLKTSLYTCVFNKPRL